MPVWLALGVLNVTSSGQESYLLAVGSFLKSCVTSMSTKNHPESAFWIAVMNLDEFRPILEKTPPATGCCCGVGSLNRPDVIRKW